MYARISVPLYSLLSADQKRSKAQTIIEITLR